MKPTGPLPKIIFDISLLLCGISLFYVGEELFSYWLEKNQRFEQARINAKQEAIYATRKIEERLRELQGASNSIANAITKEKMTNEELLNRFKSTVENNPNFLNVGAAYKPFAYNEETRLYAPYYARRNGQLEFLKVEDAYDYTEPEHDWYNKPLLEGATWVEPFFARSVNSLVAGFYAPFKKIDPETKEEVVAGVVYSNYSLNNLKELMASLNLGQSGYGFLISKKGVLLVHPVERYVRSRKTIFNIASIQNNRKLKAVAEKAINGESGGIEFVDEITGQSSWLFLEPIALNGWSMGVVFIKDEVAIDNKTLRRKLIWLSLGVASFLFFLSVLIFRAYNGSVKSLWALSSTTSLLFAIEIACVWSLAILELNYKNNRNLLVSQASTDNFLIPQFRAVQELGQKPPLLVPTGVFIQSLDFTSANDVFMTGYIWQKYYDGIHDELSRGFIFPESITANDFDVTEAYRHKVKNYEVIGWYFEASLRQQFDFTKYPFDFKDVWIRMWHQDFNRVDLNRQVILVPDLEGYEVINPTSKPGLDENFVLEGWSLESSFFEYEFNSYTTNFGLENSIPKKNFPELYFTIILRRAFIGLFIARIIPLMVVSILLFTMLLLANKDRGMEVVGACGGFVFIVILDQIAVRGEIVANGIIYFEYFYFVIYLFIFLVAMNAIMLTFDTKFPLMEYKNNLIPKLLYWPIVLSLLLLVTLSVFY